MPLIRANYKMSSAAAMARPPPKLDSLRKISNQEAARKRKKSMSNSLQHGRSSIANYGSESKFKASFKIVQKDSNTPACFKQDGERFETPETLKLMSSVNYIVTMEINPNMELLYVKFGGIENTFKLINDPENEGKAIYQFLWSTIGIEPNLSSHRSDVICSMKFKNFKELEFRLQVKFYSVDDIKHAQWGTQLNSILLECTAGRGMYDSFVNTTKFL